MTTRYAGPDYWGCPEHFQPNALRWAGTAAARRISPTALTGAVEPKTTTLPEVGATADRLGYSRSPLLDSITPTPGWTNMPPEEAKQGLAEKKPELTAEQIAKLASMIPKPTAANFPSAGNARPVDPRTITTGQLSVQQRQRPSLAQILGR